MKPLKAFFMSPTLYGVWAFVVTAALLGTCFVDPFIYGLTALTLAWISAPIGLVGLTVATFAKSTPRRARARVVIFILWTLGVVAASFVRLRSYPWA